MSQTDIKRPRPTTPHNLERIRGRFVWVSKALYGGGKGRTFDAGRNKDKRMRRARP